MRAPLPTKCSSLKGRSHAKAKTTYIFSKTALEAAWHMAFQSFDLSTQHLAPSRDQFGLVKKLAQSHQATINYLLRMTSMIGRSSAWSPWPVVENIILWGHEKWPCKILTLMGTLKARNVDIWYHSVTFLSSWNESYIKKVTKFAFTFLHKNAHYCTLS